MKRLAGIFVVTAVTAMAFSLSACDKAEEQQSGMLPIKAVKTMIVSEAADNITRSLAGVVKTMDTSEIGFRVNGRVEAVMVKLGQKVAKGEILATLEQADYKLSVQAARASLQSTRADLAAKKLEVERQRDLLQQGFTSKNDADKAETAYQSAQSSLDIATSDLQDAENKLQRTVLRAPFDSSVAEKDVEPFAEVSAGQVIFVLQGNDGLEVEVAVPETLVRHVSYGDVSTITFPTLPGVEITGSISEIAAAAGAGNAYPVAIQLAQTKEDIRAGMTAEVNMSFRHGGNGKAFVIPTTAMDLRFFKNEPDAARRQAPVYIVDNDTSRLLARYVNVADVIGNQLVVTGDINAGERMVVAGVSFLSEGQKVKLWQPQYTIPATLDK